MLLEDEGDKAMARKVIESSRKLYAYEYEDETKKKKADKTESHETQDAKDNNSEDEPIEV